MCARLSCILSFRVHVKLFYHIVSYSYNFLHFPLVNIARVTMSQNTARTALQVARTSGNWMFCPFVSSPLDILIGFLLIQLKPTWSFPDLHFQEYTPHHSLAHHTSVRCAWCGVSWHRPAHVTFANNLMLHTLCDISSWPEFNSITVQQQQHL